MQLYDFQIEAKNNARNAFTAGHRRIIIQQPTGSGKTVVASSIISSAINRGIRCLVITDRIELTESADDTLDRFEIEASTVLKGAKIPDMESQCVICMSQTLRRRIGKPKWVDFFLSFGLILIDEVHVREFDVYFKQDVFDPKSRVIGLTATPKRPKKVQQLGEIFSYMVKGPQVSELIRRGFLVPERYYKPNSFSADGIKLNSFGDYDENQMYSRIKEIVSNDSVIENWRTYANNNITIVFCSNKDHVMDTCKAFNDAGIKSKFIVSPISKPKYNDNFNDGDLIKFEEKWELYLKYKKYYELYSGNRKEVIDEWKAGEFKVLINAGIFTKGFDYKPIECVLILRKTTSETLWLQMLGRGSRVYKDKKYFTILDFCDNAKDLGMYSQDRVWELNGPFSTSESIAPVKECGVMNGTKKPDKNGNPGCGNLILASTQICRCGYVFEKEVFEFNADMVLVDSFVYKEEKYEYEGIDFARIERTAGELGKPFSFIVSTIIFKGGIDAIAEYAKYKKYSAGWLWQVKRNYAKQLERYDEMQNKKLQEQSQKRLLF